MIDDAFVFDCVAHVFNFEPKNAFGAARPDVLQSPLRLSPGADPRQRGARCRPRSSCGNGR